MPLPASWADHLFAKLAIRYGAAFMRQWPDADPALVKADWAEVLDGTSGDALSYALRYLPERPPNAIQFRDICRRAPPAPDVVAIAAPVERADPERVTAIVSRAMRPAGLPQEGPADQCARNILRIVEGRGGCMSLPQRQQLGAMARLIAPDLRTRAARYVPAIAQSLAEECTA